MLFVKKHIWNIVFVVLVCTIISKQFPIWKTSITQQGQVFPTTVFTNLDGESVQLPVKGEKSVYVFWATWCSPCHIQMNFFKKAVLKGKIKKEQIIAVNLREDLRLVQEFQDKNKYPFRIVVAQTTFKNFEVRVTPSIAYINEMGTVYEFTSGIAPLAVYKSQKFLN